MVCLYRAILLTLLIGGCSSQHWTVDNWRPTYRGCHAKVRVHGEQIDRKFLIRCKWKVSILGT